MSPDKQTGRGGDERGDERGDEGCRERPNQPEHETFSTGPDLGQIFFKGEGFSVLGEIEKNPQNSRLSAVSLTVTIHPPFEETAISAIYRFPSIVLRGFDLIDVESQLQSNDNRGALKSLLRQLLDRAPNNFTCVNMMRPVGGYEDLRYGAPTIEEIALDPGIITRCFVSQRVTESGTETLRLDLNPELGRLDVEALQVDGAVSERFTIYCPRPKDKHDTANNTVIDARDRGTRHRWLFERAADTAAIFQAGHLGSIARILNNPSNRSYTRINLESQSVEPTYDEPDMLSESDTISQDLGRYNQVQSARCNVSLVFEGNLAIIEVSGPMGSSIFNFLSDQVEPLSYIQYHYILQIFEELSAEDRKVRLGAVDKIARLSRVDSPERPLHPSVIQKDRKGDSGELTRLKYTSSGTEADLKSWCPTAIYAQVTGNHLIVPMLDSPDSLKFLWPTLNGCVQCSFTLIEKPYANKPLPAHLFDYIDFHSYPDGSFDIELNNRLGAGVWSPRCGRGELSEEDRDKIIRQVYQMFVDQPRLGWLRLATYVLSLGNRLGAEEEDDNRGAPHYVYLPDLSYEEDAALYNEIGEIVQQISSCINNPESRISARFGTKNNQSYRCALSFDNTYLPVVVLELSSRGISAIDIYAWPAILLDDKVKIDKSSIPKLDDIVDGSDNAEPWYCCTLKRSSAASEDSPPYELAFDAPEMLRLTNELAGFFSIFIKQKKDRVNFNSLCRGGKQQDMSTLIEVFLGRLPDYFPVLYLRSNGQASEDN